MARSISRKTVLTRLFDTTSQSVYVIDAERCLIYYNRALAARLQVDDSSLIGRVCHDTSRPPDPTDAGSIVDGLCPPPEVFAGRAVEAPILLSTFGNTAEAVVRFTPFDEDQHVRFVLAVVQDHAESPLAEPDRWHDQIRRIRRELSATYDIEQLVGSSAAIRRVQRQAQIAAGANHNVLLMGTQGSGRERLAKAIHYGGAPDAPLVPLACQFLDDELLHTTIVSLVGQSGEDNRDSLRTLLLLDVDQLVPEAQAELLRMITETDRASLGPRWRVISTARKPLVGPDSPVDPELALLLSTICIELPPLTSRVEDIPLLAQYLLEQYAEKERRSIGELDDAVLEVLQAHSWPGNMNELQSVVVEAAQAATGHKIRIEHLPGHMLHVIDAALHPAVEEQPVDLEQLLADMESELIKRSLRKAASNKAQAARLLGLSRAKFLRRLEQLKIDEW